MRPCTHLPAIPFSGSVERRVILAALAKCGYKRQRSSIAGSRNGESGGRGSVSYTSSAAPAIQFSRRALARAASSITGALDVFTKYAVDFIFWNVDSLNR